MYGSRHTSLYLFLLSGCLLLGSRIVTAQAPADIRPLIRDWTTAQRAVLQDTLRALGAQTGQEPQQAYEQLSEDKRQAVIRYIQAGARPASAATHSLPTQERSTKGAAVAPIPEAEPLLLPFSAIRPDTIPRTQVRWDQDTIFYGNIEEGTLLLDSFVVTNTGDRPYQIRDVRASCDCTIVKYPSNPILPGRSAAVRIEFDSTRKAGRAQPGIIVYDNSIPNRRSILYLDGEVVPRKQVKVIRQ